jgi:hypothetical protein
MSNRLKLKVRTKIPAALLDGIGTTVTKNGLTYRIDLDYSQLQDIGTNFDPAFVQVAIWNPHIDAWARVSLTDFLNGSLTSTIFDAIAPTTTRGDLIFRNATVNARLGASTAGYFLQTNGPGTDPSWNGFLQSGTGAVTRAWQDKAGDIVSVKDFGAKGDGSTNDTTAINAAFATGKTVYIPPGVYKGNFLINNSNTRVFGAGQLQSILSAANNNQTVLTVSALLGGVELCDFGIDRSVTPISGGNGLVFAGYVDDCRVSRLRIRNQFIGGILSGTGFSRFEDNNVVGSLSHNIYLSNPASGPGFQTLQWQMLGNYSAAAGGSSYVVITVPGPPGVAMGEWINNASFGSSSFDMAFIGSASCPINAVRVTGGFVGGSGNSGLFLDTYAGGHRILNFYAEYAGTGGTGPTLSTPATHIGSGIEVSANNLDVLILSPTSTNQSEDGLRLSASVSNTVIGGRLVTNTLYGARFADGAKASISNVVFNGNTVGQVLSTSNPGKLSQSNLFPALPWTTYTPTQSGTATGTASGWYQVNGKTLNIAVRFSATGTGSVTLSLPSGLASAATITQTIAGTEVGISSKMIKGLIAASGTTLVVALYDASASGAANGAILDLSGSINIA